MLCTRIPLECLLSHKVSQAVAHAGPSTARKPDPRRNAPQETTATEVVQVGYMWGARMGSHYLGGTVGVWTTSTGDHTGSRCGRGCRARVRGPTGLCVGAGTERAGAVEYDGGTRKYQYILHAVRAARCRTESQRTSKVLFRTVTAETVCRHCHCCPQRHHLLHCWRWGL
jgi:hypothetical protein